MADFWDSLLNGVISAAPSVLGGVLGADAKGDATSAAAAQQIAGANLAAQILGTGYDRSWDAQTKALGNVTADQQRLYDTLKPLYAAIPGQVTQGLTDAANAYKSNLLGDIGAAGSTYYLPAASDYSAALSGAGTKFGNALAGIAGNYASDMDALAGGLYAPYSAAGRAALANLQAIAGSNPATLTPAQQMARDDFIRQSQQSLAASGLRGSGRAQAAVLDRGLAGLAAQDFAQNQARADAASSALLQSGLTGAGQQLQAGTLGRGALLNAGNLGAQALLQAAQQGAANLNAIRTKMGDAALQGGMLGSQALLNAQTQGVVASTDAANNLINATSQYLSGKQATDLAQGQLDSNNIMGKASTAAGAAQGNAVTSAGATAANGASWGGAIGTLGSAISEDLKRALMPSSYANQINLTLSQPTQAR